LAGGATGNKYDAECCGRRYCPTVRHGRLRRSAT
jgi:hypothetical protein